LSMRIRKNKNETLETKPIYINSNHWRTPAIFIYIYTFKKKVLKK